MAHTSSSVQTRYRLPLTISLHSVFCPSKRIESPFFCIGNLSPATHLRNRSAGSTRSGCGSPRNFDRSNSVPSGNPSLFTRLHKACAKSSASSPTSIPQSYSKTSVNTAHFRSSSLFAPCARDQFPEPTGFYTNLPLDPILLKIHKSDHIIVLAPSVPSRKCTSKVSRLSQESIAPSPSTRTGSPARCTAQRSSRFCSPTLSRS